MKANIRLASKAGYAYLSFPYCSEAVNHARSIPGHRKWNAEKKCWEFKLSRASLEHVLSRFDATMSPEVAEYHEKLEQNQRQALAAASRTHGVKADSVRDYAFKTQPFDHQAEAFLRSRDLHAFGLFMEQGTGKSKIIVDTVAYLHAKGEINAALIVAPNSVKTNWVTEEFPIHMPDWAEYHAAYWEASPKKAEKAALEKLSDLDPPLKILVMNVEAMSYKRSAEFAMKFARTHKCLIAIDESTRIKTPGATRTKNTLKLTTLAQYRRILTGTPVTKSPMDLYSQLGALDPEILGYSSYYSFRNEYCVMGGYDMKEIIAYKNVEQLTDSIAPYIFRVLKKDCLDLPEKVYQRIYVDHSPEQKAAYSDMKQTMEVQLEEGDVQATIVLTQIAKLQQINSNFVNDEDGRALTVGKSNPRLETLIDLLEQHGGKAIIWARFRHDIELITQRLKEEFGPESAAAFYGDVSSEDRTKIRKQFQDKADRLQFFVGNPKAGGIGLTLTEANLVVYYSNDFDLELRLQSEDRAHRIGQVRNVTYVDLVTRGTVDTKIVSALRAKKNIADMITKDGPSEWI